MRYGIFVCFLCVTFLFSCNNDDNGDIISVPPRLLSEVVTEDTDEIQEFLQTHFYNYEEFAAPPPDFDYTIRIDTIAGANSDKTPLVDFVTAITVNVSSNEFIGLDDEDDIPHTLYYLEAIQGSGNSPTVGDSTLVKFEGSLLDGTVFDASTVFGWQYLPGTLRGYHNGIAQLNVGDVIIDNPDGTTDVGGAGVGLIVMPSGLGYFNTPPTVLIPVYSPLIFKVTTGLFVENTDFDNDGIPSILEDVDGDGNLANDNTDVDDEIDRRSTLFPNHLDADDDGDGVSTRNEISDDDGNIIGPPYPDSNNDGIPDYLDPDTN